MMQEIISLRLDKWLWVARFYKTRKIARAFIQSGKVKVNGYKIKPSKEIKVGDDILLKAGWDNVELVVKALGIERKQASVAQLLYKETFQSIENRKKNYENRKCVEFCNPKPLSKPNKKQRKKIILNKKNIKFI